MHFCVDWKRPWKILNVLKETGIRQKEMEHMGAAYMAEGIVTLVGSRLYTSAAYTEDMIDDVLVRFEAAARELKNKNAVMLENRVALCTGTTEGDAKAAVIILRKGCVADLYAAALNKTDCLSIADAYIQRIIYITKYSKIKEQRG